MYLFLDDMHIGAMKLWMDYTPQPFEVLKCQCCRKKRRYIA